MNKKKLQEGCYVLTKCRKTKEVIEGIIISIDKSFSETQYLIQPIENNYVTKRFYRLREELE